MAFDFNETYFGVITIDGLDGNFFGPSELDPTGEGMDLSDFSFSLSGELDANQTTTTFSISAGFTVSSENSVLLAGYFENSSQNNLSDITVRLYDRDTYLTASDPTPIQTITFGSAFLVGTNHGQVLPSYGITTTSLKIEQIQFSPEGGVEASTTVFDTDTEGFEPFNPNTSSPDVLSEDNDGYSYFLKHDSIAGNAVFVESGSGTEIVNLFELNDFSVSNDAFVIPDPDGPDFAAFASEISTLDFSLDAKDGSKLASWIEGANDVSRVKGDFKVLVVNDATGKIVREIDTQTGKNDTALTGFAISGSGELRFSSITDTLEVTDKVFDAKGAVVTETVVYTEPDFAFQSDSALVDSDSYAIDDPSSDGFLSLSKIAGDSLNDDFLNQFDVLGWSLEKNANVVSDGQSLEIGSEDFSLLTVDLNSNSQGIEDLLAAMVSKTTISEGKLTLRTNDLETHSFDFDNLNIVGIAEHQGRATQVAFTYDEYVTEFISYDENGKVLAKDKATVTVDGGSASIDSLGVVLASSIDQNEGDLSYFLTYGDITGSSQTEGQKGAIDITRFELDFSISEAEGESTAVGPLKFSLASTKDAMALVKTMQAEFSDGRSAVLSVVTGGGPDSIPTTIKEYEFEGARFLDYNTATGFQHGFAMQFDALTTTSTFVDSKGNANDGTSVDYGKAELPTTSDFVLEDFALQVADPDRSEDIFLDFSKAGKGFEIDGLAEDIDHLNEFEVIAVNTGVTLVGLLGSNKFSHDFVTLALDVGQAGYVRMLEIMANGDVLDELTVTRYIDRDGPLDGDYQTVKQTMQDVKILSVAEGSSNAPEITFVFDRMELQGDLVVNGAVSATSEAIFENGATIGDGKYADPITPDDLQTSLFVDQPDFEDTVSNFLFISGFNGKAVAEFNENGLMPDSETREFFDVSSYNFNLADLPGLFSGSANSGTQPITIDVELSPGVLKTLIDKINGNGALPQIKLATTLNDANSDGLDIFKLITMSNVKVLGMETQLDGITSLTFGYSNLQFDYLERDSKTGAFLEKEYEIDLALDDFVEGTDADESFYTGNGNDISRGRGGDDSFVGGSGQGDDSYFGGQGRDTVIYSSTDLGIVVDLSASKDHATGVEIDTDQLIQIENLVLGEGADRATGTELANVIEGLGARDILFGLGGRDTLIGNTGSDKLIGGSGQDLLKGGNGNDRLQGGNGKDQLFGSTGKDKLFGGNGNDLLAGGAGVDELTGQSGSDIFQFSVRHSDTDIVLDFDAAEDSIALELQGQDANINVSTDGAGTTVSFGDDQTMILLANQIVTEQDITFIFL